jgi:hypothetical protein
MQNGYGLLVLENQSAQRRTLSTTNPIWTTMGLKLAILGGSQLIYGVVSLQGKVALNVTLPLLEGISVVYKDSMWTNLEAQELPNGQAYPRCT